MFIDRLKTFRSPTHTRRRVSLLSTPVPLEPRTLLSARGIEVKINSFTTGAQRSPAIAMDVDGDFVVTWHSNGQDGSSYGIYAQRYNAAGTPQGTEFRVNSYTANHQKYADVAMDADGDFIITWQSFSQDGSGYGIYAQRYNAAGTPQGAEFRVNFHTTGNQSSPSVAMEADGDFVITWDSQGQDGEVQGIYAQRYNADGTSKGGGEFQVNSYTTNSQSTPNVAMDSDGDFVIVWDSYGQDGNSGGIYAQRYSFNGSKQGTEFRVNSFTTNWQNVPEVAMNADGDFVVTWRSFGQDGNNHGIIARRYNSAGTAQGTEIRVNSYTTGSQSSPKVAINTDGDFVITWDSYGQDGSGGGVYAQRYNAVGTPEGTEFRVNSFTTNSQSFAAVAMNAQGDFVVTWDSNTQDGNSYGIFAQGYRAPNEAYVGAWRTGSFFLDSNHNDNYDGSIDDSLIAFGSTTDKPLIGDWNGDGYSDIGVWRNGTFYLDANGNGVWDGSLIDFQFSFGLSNDTPLVGDWNRDGKDEVGVWRAGRFYLDLNANRILDAAPTDAIFLFGANTDVPVVGDWNGDGTDDVGIWRAGTFYLDLNGNRRWDRPPVDRLFEFGNSTDLPIIGDWNADGVDDIGVKRNARFLVDYNGNGVWDGGVIDYFVDFGNPTDTPLVGYWKPKTIPGALLPSPVTPLSLSLNSPPISAPIPTAQLTDTTLASLLAVPVKKRE